MNRELKMWEETVYTDDDINKLAAWLEDLTLDQIAFLKESYDSMLAAQSYAVGQAYLQ